MNNIVGTLCSRSYPGKLAHQDVEQGLYPLIEIKRESDIDMARRFAVRRLTERECEALQGFPQNWCNLGDWVDSNGKTHKDASSPQYAALGNSICNPFWYWLLGNISDELKASGVEKPLLGSLFDGIGGFDFSWAHHNGAETCRWSSEIEEFPIAVVKKHFGDETIGEQGDIENYIRRNK